MLVFFGVSLANTDLLTKGEEFSRLKGVISVSIVTGRYDLMVVVLLNQELHLVDFVTKEVTKIKDVVSTEAFVAYKNWNLKVPYVL
jgi:Lrp/AsnC family transcriptional regulator for asnA, asnC and gidA